MKEAARKGRRHHPLHPLFVHFPVALLTTTSVWDIALLIEPVGWLRTVALPNLGLGLLTSLPAIATGLIDLKRIAPSPHTDAWLLRHLGFVSMALVSYAVSFFLRLDSAASADAPSSAAVVTAAVGLVCIAVGGWYGARLAFESPT